MNFDKVLDHGVGAVIALLGVCIASKFFDIVGRNISKFVDAIITHMATLSTTLTRHDAEAQIRARQYAEESHQAREEHREIIQLAQTTHFIVAQTELMLKINKDNREK